MHTELSSDVETRESGIDFEALEAQITAEQRRKDVEAAEKKPGVVEKGRGRERNVGQMERVASALMGGALTGAGLFVAARRRSPAGIAGALLGAPLIYRGLTGHSLVYRAAGVRGDDATASSSPLSRRIHVTESISVNRPAFDLYKFFRDFRNFKRLWPSIEKIEPINERCWFGYTKGIAGRVARFEFAIEEDHPGELIAWISTPSSSIYHRGRIVFEPSKLGARVTLDMVCEVSWGVFGAGILGFLGRAPGQTTRRGLRRFKRFMESGEAISG